MLKPETCPDAKGLFEIFDLLVKRMYTLSIWKENIAQEFHLLQHSRGLRLHENILKKIG